MEFLVWARRTSNEPHLQEELEQTKQGIRQFKSDRRTKAMYGLAGEKDGFLICEVDTANELNQYLNLNPTAAYNEWEVHPLVTMEEVVSLFDMAERHLEAEEAA